MIKAIVIDDERSSVELICNLLQLYCKDVSVISTANCTQSAYIAIAEKKPDLIFLDVQMQDGNGFDLLNRFEMIEFKIIFITAHQQFAIDAFKFCAIDYLQKPISPLHLISAVEKMRQNISSGDITLKINALINNLSSSQKKKIVLKTFDKIYSVSAGEISRLESEGNYTTVHLADSKKITVSRLLKEFDELLAPEGFVRSHQSHLINLDFFYCFEKTTSTIVMKDGSKIPVSSRKKEQILSMLNTR